MYEWAGEDEGRREGEPGARSPTERIGELSSAVSCLIRLHVPSSVRARAKPK